MSQPKLLKTIRYKHRVLNKHDILKMKIERWTSSIKALILDAVLDGVITRKEAEILLPKTELDHYMQIYLANNRSRKSLDQRALIHEAVEEIIKKRSKRKLLTSI